MLKPGFMIFISSFVLFTSLAQAQENATPPPASKTHKAIMVLDASGSMWGQIDNTAKIVTAREVIGNVIEDWSPSVDLGLMAYGHRRKGDCTDIEMLSSVAPLNKSDFNRQVKALNPRGKTPISNALRLAAKEVSHETNKSSVILVSDGLETCNADPCTVASELEASGVDFTVHVVGFGVTKEESEKLSCIADNTGGKYLGAGNAKDLTLALTETVTTVTEAPPAKNDVPAKITALDLDTLSFDVQTFKSDQKTGKIVSTGTSNGVGWTVVANSIYKPLTNMKGGATFNDLPGQYDDLHVGSDFTITFDSPVTSLLVVLGNDNDTGDGPNFTGLAPVDFVDASNPDGGTQVRIEDKNGALFYYYDLTSPTLTHVNDNGINDGWDLAFFAFPKRP